MIFLDRTFAKFILVGVVNTLVGSAIMFSLYNLVGVNYWLSSASNYILVSIVSFFLNKYFTFKIKKWSFSMIIAFILTIVISYALAYGISKPAMNYLLQDSPQKIRENIALLTGMCIFTAINYLGQRLIVFTRN